MGWRDCRPARLLPRLPLGLVCLAVAWLYYAFTVPLCGVAVEGAGLRLGLLITFHILLLPFLACLVQVKYYYSATNK